MAAAAGFQSTPTFADLVAGSAWAYPVRIEGVGRWAMPVGLWHSPSGFDAKDTSGPDHHTLSVSLAGAAVEGRRGRRSGVLRPGSSEQMAIQPHRVGTDYRVEGELRFAHLYFQDDYLRGVAIDLFGHSADRGGLMHDEMPFIVDRELRAMAALYLQAALSASGPPGAFEMDSRAALICLHLLRGHSVLATRPEVRTMALAPIRLGRAKEYLEAHIADDFSLEALAATVGLSPFHFARAFKLETGVPPHRYLMERRVERARELLAGTGMGLAEIALACGFAGQSHFTTAFKRHTSVTPGAWRAAFRH